jgi:heat shock protein HtpX
MSNTLKTAMLLGLLTGLIIVIGNWVGGTNGMLIALVLAAGMNFFSYWFSDRIVLAMTKARPLSEAEAPRVHAITRNLCARAGIPVPRIYLLPQEAPNAFATGRNPEHAAMAVTAGLVQMMDEAELEGVIAHELSHIKHRDILISSIAATIAGAVMVLASIARWGAIFGGYGTSRDDDGGGVIPILLTAILAPLAAMLIQAAISRSREFEADAGAAEMSGNPEGLARALLKLDSASKRIPMQASPTTSHMYIVKPLGGRGLAGLFSTHPPIEQRVARLRGNS